MIRGHQFYEVLTTTLPLYTALFLGFASIKWWKLFKPDHCDAINRFNYYFVMPFFTFQFISNVNPYEMNFRFLAADIIAKALIGVALVAWANFAPNGTFGWSITNFSLASLNSPLLLGVPLLQAMYGDQGADLVVQVSVVQALLWLICLLFMLELRRAKLMAATEEAGEIEMAATEEAGDIQMAVTEEAGDIQMAATEEAGDIEMAATEEAGDIEMAATEEAGDIEMAATEEAGDHSHSLTFWGIMKTVAVKLAKNPNSYACIVGLIWALVSKRWHFGMPEIIKGQILIMSKGGAGLGMFTMGLYMALQENVIACGAGIALYALVLRFLVGPATTLVGAVITGLHGDVLRIALIQAALPQALTAFVYHQEYGLHSQVLNTAVIFGTIISLPLLIGYYAVLDILHL